MWTIWKILDMDLHTVYIWIRSSTWTIPDSLNKHNTDDLATRPHETFNDSLYNANTYCILFPWNLHSILHKCNKTWIRIIHIKVNVKRWDSHTTQMCDINTIILQNRDFLVQLLLHLDLRTFWKKNWHWKFPFRQLLNTHWKQFTTPVKNINMLLSKNIYMLTVLL